MVDNDKKMFDVALSYAREDGDFVSVLAEILKRNEINVFFDRYFRADLWGTNLWDKFDDIFRKKSKFVIIFISRHYASKQWTNHERKSALARALKEKNEYILPARFDNTEIDGISPTVNYIDLSSETPESFAKLIIEKVNKFKKSDEVLTDLTEESDIDDLAEIRNIYKKILTSTNITQLKRAFYECEKYLLFNDYDPDANALKDLIISGIIMEKIRNEKSNSEIIFSSRYDLTNWLASIELSFLIKYVDEKTWQRLKAKIL